MGTEATFSSRKNWGSQTGQIVSLLWDARFSGGAEGAPPNNPFFSSRPPMDILAGPQAGLPCSSTRTSLDRTERPPHAERPTMIPPLRVAAVRLVPRIAAGRVLLSLMALVMALCVESRSALARGKTVAVLV